MFGNIIKGEKNEKSTSLTGLTFHTDISAMSFYNCFYVKQTNPEAFNVMEITGRYPVKLFENMIQIYLFYYSL